MLKFLREQLAKLLEQRKALAAERDAIVAEAEKRGNLTEADQTKFDEKRAAIKAIDDEIATKQTRIAELEEDEKREQTAAQIAAAAGQTGERRSGGAVVTSEPMTYSRHSGHSYFHDMARAQFRADHVAQERLNRHAAELRVELPAREKRREERARAQMDEIATAERWKDEQRASAFEQRVNPNRTDGQGGRLVAAAAA